MRKKDIKLIIIEFLSLVFIALNIFIKNITNNFIIIIILLLLFIYSIYLSGFEKNKFIFKKKYIKYMVIFTFTILLILYGLGLYTGFLKSSYSLTFLNIIKNCFPIVIIIILTEMFRYNCCNKFSNSFLIITNMIIITIGFDLLLCLNQYNFGELSEILKFIIFVLIPSIINNIILTVLSKKFGYEGNIIYQIISRCYIYVVPFVPDIGEYLNSVFLTLFPIIIFVLLNFVFETKEKINYENKLLKKIILIPVIILTIIIVLLNSNLIRYWVAVVGSGSMEPTINVGDMVLIDKSYKKRISEIKNGDVLVFKINDLIYVHRIIEKKEVNGVYQFKTKGDRKENTVDPWNITEKEIIGIVKYKIPYIGRPSIWLKNFAR